MSPSEVDCLWLYLKDGVLTLDQFSTSAELDRAVRVTAGTVFMSGNDCRRLGHIDDYVINVTPTAYLI